MPNRKPSRAADKLRPIVRKVIEAMADPKNLSGDDQGMVCQYCTDGCGHYDFCADPSEYPHKDGCPVLLAREILANTPAEGRLTRKENHE